MNRLFCCIAVLLSFMSAMAQDSTDISGVLNDKWGPLPGATIKQLGTTRGTQSDFDGYYTFRVPVACTVEVSYMGMETKRFIVQKDGKLLPVNKEKWYEPKKQEGQSIKVQVTRDTHSEKASTLRTNKQNETPIAPQDFLSYYDSLQNNKESIAGIAPLDTILPLDNKSIIVSDFPIVAKVCLTTKRDSLGQKRQYYELVKRSPEQMFYLSHPRIIYSFTSAANSANRLPKAQETWAQGRPINGNLQWQGYDAGESFSWGPKVSELSSMGNAVPTYNRSNTIQRGFSILHDLSLEWGIKERYINVSGYRRSTIGYFGSSQEIEYGAQFKSKIYDKPKTKLDIQGKATTSDGQMQLQGANYAQIMESSLLTPATFDNLNGLSPSATNKTAAWQTSSGAIRSFSGSNPLNPYYLMAKNNDTKKTNSATAGLQFTKELFHHKSNKDFPENDTVVLCEFRLNASYVGNNSFVHYGNWQLQNFTQHDIKQQQSQIDASFFVSKEKGSNWSAIIKNIQLGFRLDDERAQIHRQTSIDTALTCTRFAKTAYVVANYSYHDWLRLTARNLAIDNSQFAKLAYFNPSASIGLAISQMNWFKNNENFRNINYFNIYSNYSNLAYLPSLLPEYGALNTLLYSYKPGLLYYEQKDYYYPKTSNERVEQFASGLNVAFLKNKLTVDFSAFKTNTTNHLTPVIENGIVSYQNAIDYVNRGGEISASYRMGGYSRYYAEIFANIQRNNPIVSAIHTSQTELPIVGTADVYKAAIVGQPYGVLVGSAYLRNADGKMIIGEDGFPLVNPKKQIIGNPNPDFILNVGGYFERNKLSVSMVFSLQKGGQIWNGTRGVMNYYGVSAETGEQRTITGYVFDGVTSDGQPNTKAVDFAPTSDVTKNRWQRYGTLGVAEDLIEDATNFRLQHIDVMYKFPIYGSFLRTFMINEIKCGVFVKNIILVSAYKGVDPQSTLFGYSSGNGLDLFNSVAMSQVGIKCNVYFNK